MTWYVHEENRMKSRTTRRWSLPWFTRLTLALLPFALMGCGGCAREPSPWGEGRKLRVLTSIAPLFCFAAQIAEPEASVLCLLGTTGPHDYQPTSHDAKLLATADVFIVNGLGLEEFLDSMIAGSGNSKLRIVKAGDAIPKDRILISAGVPHYHGDKLVVHEGTDPHVWLGMDEAKAIVARIGDELAAKDPAHAEAYRTRQGEVLKRLDHLAEQGRDLKLPGGLVTFHDSFRYFARSFNIEIVGVIRGLRGEEISAGQLQEQTLEFRKKNVRFIGVEPQYPRRVAENLAKSIGADRVKLIDLDPLETGTPVPGRPHRLDPEEYFEKMERNLKNLKAAASP